MEGVEVVMRAWNTWGIQALVLLSFTLQVTLLILAEFRRFVDSRVLRFFVWSAYMAADSIAIYVLGHMSVTSRSLKYELVAFWAPFLLMHLGGQDSITAYAIEDNRLWLRHLQTLVVQTAATGYIICESFIVGSPLLLRWATIIMFMVGSFKYGERVWALKSAATSSMGRNYEDCLGMWIDKGDGFRRALETRRGASKLKDDTEVDLMMARQALEIPMELLKDAPTSSYVRHTDFRKEGRLFKVIELQVSMMYDVFYTKAEVIHSNFYGLCIRMLSTMATAATLFLFHLLTVLGDHHRRHITNYTTLDTMVSYFLLVGAVVLETISLLREMVSNWTCDLLERKCRVHSKKERKRRSTKGGMHIYASGRTTRKRPSLGYYVMRNLTSLRRLIHAADWRWRCIWSRSMGQHNLLQVCTRTKTSRSSKIARWMDAEDWWNTLAYSWSIPVSGSIETLLIKYVLAHNARRDSFDSKGQEKLREWKLYEMEHLEWNMETRIIVWHIATSLYMSWYYKKEQAEAEQSKKQQAEAEQSKAKAKAVEALSNYMMFLLAARPHMLPPATSRHKYLMFCNWFTTIDAVKGYETIQDLVNFLAGNSSSYKLLVSERPSLKVSCELGKKLISEKNKPGGEQTVLELLEKVWVEVLFYAANGCSAYSHAKQLSNGSELITVAAFLVAHMRNTCFMSWNSNSDDTAGNSNQRATPGQPYMDSSSSQAVPALRIREFELPIHNSEDEDSETE